MALTLSRRVGQQIKIGENITVTIQHIGENKIRIAVDAPKETSIVRSELLEGDKAA